MLLAKNVLKMEFISMRRWQDQDPQACAPEPLIACPLCNLTETSLQGATASPADGRVRWALGSLCCFRL